MEMGAGGAAGGADGADEHAGFDRLTHRNGHRFQMKVTARHAKAVIDNHGVAGQIEIADENDMPARHLAHGRTFMGREIDAVMGRARLAVQDALAAIDARHHAARGADKPF
jgi:hypothetical protein